MNRLFIVNIWNKILKILSTVVSKYKCGLQWDTWDCLSFISFARSGDNRLPTRLPVDVCEAVAAGRVARPLLKSFEQSVIQWPGLAEVYNLHSVILNTFRSGLILLLVSRPTSRWIIRCIHLMSGFIFFTCPNSPFTLPVIAARISSIQMSFPLYIV